MSQTYHCQMRQFWSLSEAHAKSNATTPFLLNSQPDIWIVWTKIRVKEQGLAGQWLYVSDFSPHYGLLNATACTVVASVLFSSSCLKRLEMILNVRQKIIPKLCPNNKLINLVWTNLKANTSSTMLGELKGNGVTKTVPAVNQIQFWKSWGSTIVFRLV